MTIDGKLRAGGDPSAQTSPHAVTKVKKVEELHAGGHFFSSSERLRIDTSTFNAPSFSFLDMKSTCSR